MKDNFFLEINLECVLRVDETEKEKAIDRINKLIYKIMKDEDAVHFSSNINLVSEKSLMYAMTNMDYGEVN
jgi:hypothetical protein